MISNRLFREKAGNEEKCNIFEFVWGEHSTKLYQLLFNRLLETAPHQPNTINSYHAIDGSLRTGGFTTDNLSFFLFALLHMRLCMKKNFIGTVLMEEGANASETLEKLNLSIDENAITPTLVSKSASVVCLPERSLGLAIAVARKAPGLEDMRDFYAALAVRIKQGGDNIVIYCQNFRLLPREVTQRLPFVSLNT